MNVFKKLCHCHTREIPFRSTADFDAHAVKQVYCNLCSKNAKTKDVEVTIKGVPGWSGHYAIDWNEGYLEQHDPNFKKTKKYAADLLKSGKIALGIKPPSS